MTIEERKQRMKEAGIPMPINEGSVSIIPVTAQNADKHARLQALKSGANKQKIQNLVNSQSAQKEFQGIPEVKQKTIPKNHQNQVAKVKTVSVENNFGHVAYNSDLAAIEAMMDDRSSVPIYNPNHQVQNTTQPELSINSNGYDGPIFDPINALAKRRQELKDSENIKPYQQQLDVISPEMKNFDFQNMQKMMEQIAKKTISEILNSYTEKNKDKLTYEHVNVKTGDGTKVIKTQDGKYFKLIPVTLKKS